METYQPIYDAVRSRLSNCDIGAAIETAMREANVGHYAMQAAESIRQAAGEYERPSVIYRPTLSLDGNAWIALYGENLQEGVAGCGDSPAEAMRAFDNAWYAKANIAVRHAEDGAKPAP
jgi:hypothetical protein